MKYKRKCNLFIIILIIIQGILGKWESSFFTSDPVRFYFKVEIAFAILILVIIEIFEYKERKKFYSLKRLLETEEIQKELKVSKIACYILIIILIVSILGMFYGPILIIK